MARSFFERLTGSVRVNDDDASEPESGVSDSKTRFQRRGTGWRAKETEKPGIIHPVANSNSGAVSAASDEEGQLTVDIYDDGSSIVIQSSVAGVKPEDIDISLQEETLTVRGTRQRHKEVNDGDFYYRELYWGTFSRSIILPEEVDFSKAEASIKNGLLTVRMPKKDRSEKKIRIKME